jgi:predicted transcriptional regulator
MSKEPIRELTRKERQVMDVVYQSAPVTAAEIMENLPDKTSYSAVRAVLRVLVEKGYLRHRHEGVRYVYVPTVPREKARASALKHVVETFFGGSPGEAMVSLLDESAARLQSEDLDRLEALIQKARKGDR